LTRSSPERREQKHKGKKRNRAWHHGPHVAYDWLAATFQWPEQLAPADVSQAVPLPLVRVGNTNRGATAP
jgi:hypothetical protein